MQISRRNSYASSWWNSFKKLPLGKSTSSRHEDRISRSDLEAEQPRITETSLEVAPSGQTSLSPRADAWLLREFSGARTAADICCKAIHYEIMAPWDAGFKFDAKLTVKPQIYFAHRECNLKKSYLTNRLIGKYLAKESGRVSCHTKNSVRPSFVLRLVCWGWG